MKKSQNLKTIIVAEIVLILCILIGFAGIVIYAGMPQITPASENPPAEVPTATAILANTPTAEAAATATLAITPTPGMKGMALEKQPEGTTKFTDFDGGYEVIFPVGWLAVRPGDAEFDAALAKEGTKNAMLAEQMNIDKSGYEAEFDRVFSYPLRPDIKKNVIWGFSKTHFDPADDIPLDKNSMGDFVHKLEASNAVQGLRVTAADIAENGNGISFMVVRGRFVRKNSDGDMIPFSVTVLFFKPMPESLVNLNFTILQDYQEQIAPDLDAIRESIKLLGQ